MAPPLTKASLAIGKLALVITSLVAIVISLYISARRLFYPYELEWLESGMLEHGRRVAEGLPLYTAPGVNFTQYPYPPVFFEIVGALGFVTETDFWTGRAVSIAATVLILVLLVRIVRRETGARWAGLLAAGVYGASFGYTGGFFDVGKADSLFLAFTLLGIDRVRVAKTNRDIIVAGFVFALAIMTKQTALFVAAPVGLYWIITSWRRGLIFSATVGVLIGGVTAIWTYFSDGWFFFFVWQLLLEHDEVPGARLRFFQEDLLPFWPALIAVVLAWSTWWKREQRWASGMFGAALVGLMAGALASRLHEGGFVNVLMPAVAGVAIAIGIAAGWLVKKEHWKRAFPVVVLCALQLYFLRYDVSNQLPTAADRAAGDAFIADVRGFEGPVLISAHPTYAVLAGKPAYASQGGIIDIIRGTNTRAKDSIYESYADAIHNREFSALMFDSQFDDDAFPADWQEFYCPAETDIFPASEVFRPITSKTNHPEQLYLPCVGEPGQ